MALIVAGCASAPPAPAPPAAAPPPAAVPFRIVEAALRADPPVHPGPCPATIRFTARISALGAGGTVAYRFVRSDGASGPVQTVVFQGPASKDVTTTWQLASNFEGWQQLVILQPHEMKSNRAGFSVSCP